MPDPQVPVSPATEEEIVKAIQVAQAAEPKKDGPIELQLETGELVKAQNQQDLIQKLKGMKENTTLHAKQVEAENADLRQQLAAREAEKAAPDRGATEFDKKKYWDYMADDPMLAQNYMDAYRFGIDKPENVVATFQRMNTAADQFNDNVAVTQFYRRVPEFPGGDEPSVALLEEHAKTYGGVLKPETLEASFIQCVRQGKIRPLTADQTVGQTQRRPMPSLSGSGQTDASGLDSVAEFSKLSADQMERVLMDLGRKGR